MPDQSIMLAKAIAIAAKAFENKVDKGGQPYILHCLYVMNGVGFDNLYTAQAAVLHDLFEDCLEWDAQRLKDEGFDFRVIHMVMMLTKLEGQDYMDYIRSLKGTPELVKIKRKDLEHNTLITRLKGLTAKDHERMEKYHTAYVYLSKI
jgi:(p)ppGpp synthase/HD superfamily hydrolase